MNPWTTASRLDRVDEHRGSAAWVAGQWRQDDAQLLKLDERGQCFVSETGELRLTKPFVAFDPERHFLLGTVDDAPVFAVEAIADGPVRSLRDVWPDVDETERDIAVTAVALTHWHRVELYCPRDGGPTTVARGGFARICEDCDAELFPRSDPAVIVAILDGADRLLLGHHVSWDPGRVSVLAGFAEAGESLEQAVHREVAEESDVRLGELTYFGSQPWPFPRSLMVGYFARATSDAIAVDGDEIEWARWFSRDEVRASVSSGEISLPGEASIARRMINTWLAGSAPS